MITDTVSIEQFVAENRITMEVKRAERNPNMADSSQMDHWKVTLVRKDPATYRVKRAYRMTITFSMGYGHHGAEPKVGDVLECLASDASSVDNAGDFERWCAEIGYDPDSRKHEKTYKACEHQASRLKTFLGEDLYQTLLYGTERQ